MLSIYLNALVMILFIIVANSLGFSIHPLLTQSCITPKMALLIKINKKYFSFVVNNFVFKMGTILISIFLCNTF